MRIDILLYDGFDEVDAVGPFEVLGNVSFVRPEVEVRMVALDGPGEVAAAHGLRVAVEAPAEAPDLVLVPGGGWRKLPGSPQGTRREYESGRLPARLAELHASGATLASVCTGAMLLARAGITDGRPATTHRAVLDDLAADGADVDREARVVDDGDLVTCGGVTSGFDLALRVVEREWGAELADGIARLMEHERRGPVRVTSATAA